MADKVLEACPSTEWRCLFALARYGGLRTPSEPFLLTRGDIDFVRGTILVHSPKTEHHEGKAKRIMPLFPELREPLEALREIAPDFDPKRPSTAFIFQKLRPPTAGRGNWRRVNLRSQFERIITRAGLLPWPRLFHNLRASRQTELTDRFPDHVVATWLGNTVRIAKQHYLQVTDAHHAQAVRESVRADGIPCASVQPPPNGDMQKPARKRKTPAVAGVENVSEWAVQDSNL